MVHKWCIHARHLMRWDKSLDSGFAWSLGLTNVTMTIVIPSPHGSRWEADPTSLPKWGSAESPPSIGFGPVCIDILVSFVLSRRIRQKKFLPTSSFWGCRDVLTLVVLRSITTFQATMFPPPATRYGQLYHWICLNNFTGSQTFGFWSSPLCKCCRSRSPQQHLGLLWCHWSEFFLWHSAKMLMKTSKGGVMTAGSTIKHVRCPRPLRIVPSKLSGGQMCRLVGCWNYIATSLCLLTFCHSVLQAQAVCMRGWVCRFRMF